MIKLVCFTIFINCLNFILILIYWDRDAETAVIRGGQPIDIVRSTYWEWNLDWNLVSHYQKVTRALSWKGTQWDWNFGFKLGVKLGFTFLNVVRAWNGKNFPKIFWHFLTICSDIFQNFPPYILIYSYIFLYIPI